MVPTLYWSNVAPVIQDPLNAALQTHFGLSEFRPGQREITEAMLAGRDVIAVMPTGSGKSLCFQLPAVLGSGTTVIVSPLIALMKDQVDALRARGIAAFALHSLMSVPERAEAEAALTRGAARLLYVAPERIASAGFRAAIRRARPDRLVVDEAHCISQWGHDFRPDYRRIGPLRAELGIPAAAFTATATPDVRADIASQLGMESPLELVTGFERPNLTLSIEPCRGRDEKASAIERLIREAGTPGIVYAATRKNVEQWMELCRSLGLRTGCYHAGLPDDERVGTQDRFLSGELEVITATNAFGMGIDKRDLRFVLHADLPGSIEAYYQEAGRAGRDGAAARCALLFSPADIRTQEFFMAAANPEPAVFGRVWEQLGRGARDTEVEDDAGPDSGSRMAAATAYRFLIRAAEAAGVEPGRGSLPVDFGARREKARRDRQRLDAMIRYAFAQGCRTRFIYDYFAGQSRGGAQLQCGTCDVCLGWRHGVIAALDDAEYEQVRIALSGVGRLSGRFGAERIAQVLIGSADSAVTSRGLDRIPTYGRLAALGLERTRKLLSALVDAGLLERHALEGARIGAFVLVLTSEGRRVAMGESRPELAFPRLEQRSRSRAPRGRGRAPVTEVLPASTGPVDPVLFGRLKAWRSAEARSRSVPAYVVFSDATLAEIASARPGTSEALLRIRGIGPAKAVAYGEALLQLVSSKS